MNFDFDVRLSAELLNQLHQGEVTPSMLLTMTCLYNWADWNTGRVANVSAGGLETWTRKAYTKQTFKDALQRLEWMGWITRHKVPGSHRSYAVTIHNYKRTTTSPEGILTVEVLNKRELQSCWDSEGKYCVTTTPEGIPETTPDGVPEGVPRTTLKPSLNPNLKTQSQEQGFQSASKSDSQPRPPVAITAEEQEKPQDVRSTLANQEQEQPQISPKTKALVGELGCNAKIPALLGIPYFEGDHEPDMIRIVNVLRDRRRSIHWLESMIIWVKQAQTRETKFWSTRIHTGTRAIGQIAKHLESGEICEQFDSFCVVKGGSDVLDFGKAYNIFSEDCMREDREMIERRLAGKNNEDYDPAADDTAAQAASASAGGFAVEELE